MTTYFTKKTFGFLRELAEHNDKEWWEDNKSRYVQEVREPALAFINDFAPRLAKISDAFTADSRTVGGSLMRPYRDVRFSKDKTPYKTNVGIQFRHVRGKDVHAPGFYLHLQPRENFAGVGLWHPETKVAREIRQAIHDNPDAWKKATRAKSFTDFWDASADPDEMLKRVPSGFDPDHPFADDLRMKSFTAGGRLTQEFVTSDSLVEDLAARYRRAAPLARFLCEAIGLPF